MPRNKPRGGKSSRNGKPRGGAPAGHKKSRREERPFERARAGSSPWGGRSDSSAASRAGGDTPRGGPQAFLARVSRGDHAGAPRRDDRGPRRDDRGPRRRDDRGSSPDHRGPRQGDQGPRKDHHGAARRSDRGPHRDDRGPRRDQRGPRRDDRGARREERGVHTLKAIVDKHHKGFAFLAVQDSEKLRQITGENEDLFVPPREASGLFHGDRVEVSLSAQGRITQIKVLSHRFRELVGRFEALHRGPPGQVTYERKRMREIIPILKLPETQPGKPRLQNGDWVRIKLTFHERGEWRVSGDIVDVYGADLPPHADIGMIAAEFALEEEHSEAAEAAAQQLGTRVSEEDIAERVSRGGDLRKIPFITIDGETARDFDDAVYVERDPASKGGYVLWVAIADVSHYVRENGPIDQDAIARATSVYFPERAFHMLPRALSENLCSLRPKEPRMAMVARMEMDRHGKRTRTEVMEAVIESRRRATYNEIQKEWEANGKNRDWEYAAHFELYRLLRKQREDRGSIDFELPESEVVCEPTGEVIAIRGRARLDAHRLIEEFMIAANEAVTVWAEERDWPFVYRIHDEPTMMALQKFQALARTVGVTFRAPEGKGTLPPKVLADLVKELESHPAKELLNSTLLRSMKQAIYSAVPGGHYGLASDAYTHFTSPIRRYPDLMVHRLLRAITQAQKAGRGAPQGAARDKLLKELESDCEHCSYRERLAAEAERESIKLKQVRLMREHVGDEFEGRITGMVESGFFVATGVAPDEPYTEGHVHKDTFDDDFYEWNEERMVFTGRRKRKQYKIGDRLRVQVLKADLDRRQIDFRVVPGDAAPSQRGPRPERAG